MTLVGRHKLGLNCWEKVLLKKCVNDNRATLCIFIIKDPIFTERLTKNLNSRLSQSTCILNP